MEFLDGATLKHLIGNLPDVCVMVEQMKDGRELFRFDPIGGRGQNITQAEGLVRPDRWSLSFDGKKITTLSDSATDRIEILDLQNGGKSAIELKDWVVQYAAWALTIITFMFPALLAMDFRFPQ